MFEWFKKKAARRIVPLTAGVREYEMDYEDFYYNEEPVEIPKPTVTNQHVGYIIVKDSISLTINGKPYSIGRTHVNFDKIVVALKAEQFDKLETLINVGATITRKTKGKVTVNEFGEVLHDGKSVHNVIAIRISEFVRQGLPFEPLVRFLENLMLNPSERSIEQLYAFLEHGGFPITPDGCFLGYKGVTKDFKDKHTQKFDNSVGAKQTMRREDVNPDPHAACSVGFHVGTHQFATEFVGDGGQVVMVKVNPRDAVSVPHDASCQKLRVCDYEVVAMCPGKVVEPLSTIGYQGDDLAEDDYDEAEDDFEETEEIVWNADDDTLEDAKEEPVKTKRAACTFCGSKGGKRHEGSCKRPRR